MPILFVPLRALKRMNGEDVYGHRVSTSLEAELPHSSHPPMPHSSSGNDFQHLVGPGLGQSFPPSQKPRNVPMPPYRTPPLPGRHIIQHPLPAILPQPLHPHPGHRYPFQPPPINPRGPPYSIVPPNNAAIRGGGGRGGMQPDYRHSPPLDVHRPVLHLPQSKPLPRFPHPPCANIKNLPKGPIPRHDGRILVFKVSPEEEPHMEHSVHALQVDAFFSAQHKVLWHSYSEMQVLFKLDFIQTAIIRDQDIIKLLYEKGELPTKVSLSLFFHFFFFLSIHPSLCTYMYLFLRFPF